MERDWQLVAKSCQESLQNTGAMLGDRIYQSAVLAAAAKQLEAENERLKAEVAELRAEPTNGTHKSRVAEVDA